MRILEWPPLYLTRLLRFILPLHLTLRLTLRLHLALRMCLTLRPYGLPSAPPLRLTLRPYALTIRPYALTNHPCAPVPYPAPIHLILRLYYMIDIKNSLSLRVRHG